MLLAAKCVTKMVLADALFAYNCYQALALYSHVQILYSILSFHRAVVLARHQDLRRMQGFVDGDSFSEAQMLFPQ